MAITRSMKLNSKLTSSSESSSYEKQKIKKRSNKRNTKSKKNISKKNKTIRNWNADENTADFLDDIPISSSINSTLEYQKVKNLNVYIYEKYNLLQNENGKQKEMRIRISEWWNDRNLTLLHYSGHFSSLLLFSGDWHIN